MSSRAGERTGAARLLLRIAALSIALLAALALSLSLGPAPVGWPQVLDVLGGGGSTSERSIVLTLRVPRAALAALVGAALALSGATFQALLRNPLAEPYVLGVSGGASLGAVAAVVLGWTAAGAWALPGAALVGGLLAIGLVLQIGRRAAGTRLDTRTLLLAGVVAGAFFNALVLLLLTFGEAETFRAAVYWMMGSVSGATGTQVATLALWLVPAGVALLGMARPLNLLAVGEETALHLGVRVEALKRAAYLLASLLAAAAVAVSGAIGFVGLVVPHAARLLWGSDHRRLLPAAALGGAIFLVLADTAARSAVPPAELPVGVVTALVGVPWFLVLLVRRGSGPTAGPAAGRSG